MTKLKKINERKRLCRKIRKPWIVKQSSLIFDKKIRMYVGPENDSLKIKTVIKRVFCFEEKKKKKRIKRRVI